MSLLPPAASPQVPGLRFLHCYKISVYNSEIELSHFFTYPLLSSKPFVWRGCSQKGQKRLHRKTYCITTKTRDH